MIFLNFAKKYKPKTLNEVIGQQGALLSVKGWLKNWKKGEAMIIWGPTGTGKNSIAEAIASENKWHMVKLSPSENRSAAGIAKSLTAAATQRPLLIKNRIILIDDIDVITTEDRGAVKEIVNIIKKSIFPIILTANNIYVKKIEPIRKVCRIVQLNKIGIIEVEKKLNEICEMEKIEPNKLSLKILARSCGGDLRSAINDLEVAAVDKKINLDSIGHREREINIFEVMKVVFKTKKMKTAVDVMNESDKSYDELLLWLEENICNEYEDPVEVAQAFEALSKADMFRAKVSKNMNYRFIRYASNMLSGVSLAKKNHYSKFTNYRPPNVLMMLGRTKKSRAEMKEKYTELGSKLHCSRKKVADQMPFLSTIMDK